MSGRGRRKAAATLAVGLLGLPALLAPSGASGMTETIVPCREMKTRWSRALRSIDPSRPELVFARPTGRGGTAERVSNLADVEASLSCLDGYVGRIEVRQNGPAESPEALRSFLVVSASVLAAFDAPATQAADAIAALRAAAESRRTATDLWGAYEITFTKAGAAGGAEFTLGRSEN